MICCARRSSFLQGCRSPPSDATSHLYRSLLNDLDVVLVDQGKTVEAIREFQAALGCNPTVECPNAVWFDLDLLSTAYASSRAGFK